MKLDKKLIIILALSSLLLSAIGGAVYLYMQNKKIIQKSNTLKVVYIANKNIAKNMMVTKEDIKSVQVSAASIFTTPLLENEIVGKYATDTIYLNDTFRKEKLSNNVAQEEKIVLDFAHTGYNIAFKNFQNPNYSLKQGELINIISVFPSQNSKENMDYAVQYVAHDIKVLGFLYQGGEMVSPTMTKKQKVPKSKGSKEMVEVDATVFAEEIVLDIGKDTLLDLLNDYNKGRQLWMVKVKDETLFEEPLEEKNITKETLITPAILPPKKIKKIKKVSSSSKYKWYEPKPIVLVQEAIITYENTNKVAKTGKSIIPLNDISECNQRQKLLQVITKSGDLMIEPSYGSKKHDSVKQNTIIAYKNSINDNWYLVCDGTYINKNQVTTISLEEAINKIYGK